MKNSEQNFPLLLGYSVARTAHHDDSFRGILDLEASPVEGQQLQQKDKKIRKMKGEKNSN